MLLPTMTYEEIYLAVKREFKSVVAHFQEIKPQICKRAQKAKRYPFRQFIDWEHPVSRNKYYYFVQVHSHSMWDKPIMTIFCEYEGKYGREMLIPIPAKNHLTFKEELLLQVFPPHFYKRYGERLLNSEADDRERVALFLMRNDGALPISKDCVTQNQDPVPGYMDEALLTIDGLCLGLRNNANRNILIYNTFISFEQLFQKQYEKVLAPYLWVVCRRAMLDSPKNQELIRKIYEEGTQKIKACTLDSNLSDKQKQDVFNKEYNTLYHNLIQYII